MSSSSPETRAPATLKRRFAAMFYELLLLGAVLFTASFLIVWVLPYLPVGVSQLANQIFLLVVAGGYFVLFWRRGGQTLAMKTWQVRLVSADGKGISRAQAWTRYGVAVIGGLCLGLTFWWALWDRDRQFLHDRVAGTWLLYVPR